MTRLEADPEVRSPALYMEQRVVQISTDAAGGTGGVVWVNVGHEDLHITDVQLSDSRLFVDDLFSPTDEPDGVDLAMEPDSGAYVGIGVGGAAQFVATLSVATNDPDHLRVEIPVQVNQGALQIGDTAPDFLLPGISGEMVRLSELRGNVVYLKFFNAL